MSDNAPILIVPIARVEPHGDCSSYSLRKIQSVLLKQGQIEPLQVKKTVGDGYITFSCDPWGKEILCGARALGWDTILIAVVDKYEA